VRCSAAREPLDLGSPQGDQGLKVRRRVVALTVACLLLALAPAARATLRPADDRGPWTDQRLSDERTLTRWAHPARLAWVHAAPDGVARRVARLHWLTEDGAPEVYLALRAAISAHGRVWIEIRVPRRPNGTTGWVRLGDLGRLHVVREQIVIDRAHERLTLRRDGRVGMSAPVGVGAPSTATPAGHFYVREKLANLDGDPLYGPWAFGTSDYSHLTEWPGGGVVGIHGTDEPGLIPGRPSHGCVRLRNPDIVRLARLAPVGTPVLIR
jgi:hypothetical protein